MPALNLRYLTAIILLDGELEFVAAQSLERMRSDARVRELMSRAEVEAKALRLMSGPLGAVRAQAMVDRGRDLETCAVAADLVGLIAR